MSAVLFCLLGGVDEVRLVLSSLSRSSFCLTSFALSELTKPVLPVILGPTAFFWQVGYCAPRWLGGQVRGLVQWYNLRSFLVESTSVDCCWLASRLVDVQSCIRAFRWTA